MKTKQNIDESNISISKPFSHPIFSQDYLEWVKQANLPPLTNTQHRFAEWLLLEDNVKIISQIGELDIVFASVRKWLKNNAMSFTFFIFTINIII